MREQITLDQKQMEHINFLLSYGKDLPEPYARALVKEVDRLKADYLTLFNRCEEVIERHNKKCIENDTLKDDLIICRSELARADKLLKMCMKVLNGGEYFYPGANTFHELKEYFATKEKKSTLTVPGDRAGRP